MIDTNAVETDQGLVTMPDARAGGGLEDTRLLAGPPPEAIRLPLGEVQPSPKNPRENLGDIEDLAANIHRYGLMQPVTVRRVGEDSYEVIAGHRRRQAFLRLRDEHPHEPQWRTIPAVIKKADDETAYLMLLSSQLHSKNFTPHEEATALEAFDAANWTLERIADALNRSVPWASKRRRIYQDPILSGPVQAGKLAPGVADELVVVQSSTRRQELADKAIELSWTQDEARKAIRDLTPAKTVTHMLRLVRELAPMLEELHPDDLSANAQKELWGLRDSIGRLAQRPRRGQKREVVIPTIERAQEVAGVSRNPRPRRTTGRPKPGLKLPQSLM